MIIAVGMAAGEMMWSHTANDLVAAVAYTKSAGIDIQTIIVQQSRIEIARNKIVATALSELTEVWNHGKQIKAAKGKADYIFMVDSDARFPHDVMLRLLKHKKEIIGCNAAKREDTGILAIRKDLFGKPMSKNTTGIRQVKFIGMHCTLIDTKIFDRLEKPYFYVQFEKGTENWRGEDYCFCWSAREKQIPIWCDMDLSKEIGHLGEKDYRII